MSENVMFDLDEIRAEILAPKRSGDHALRKHTSRSRLLVLGCS